MRNRGALLGSVMLIVLASMLVGAGTTAYFSDIEKSTDNTFTAGTIDLSAPVIIFAEMSDLKPCEEGIIVIEIHNDGTNEMDVWKHIFNVVTEENGVIEPEEEYYIANAIPDPPGKNDIDTVITYDLWLEVRDDTGTLIWEGFIINPSIEELKISEIASFWIYLGSLPPCWTFIVIQSYHMQPETENWAQSDKMTFDIEFYAEQLGGPGPSPELPGYGRSA